MNIRKIQLLVVLGFSICTGCGDIGLKPVHLDVKTDTDFLNQKWLADLVTERDTLKVENEKLKAENAALKQGRKPTTTDVTDFVGEDTSFSVPLTQQLAGNRDFGKACIATITVTLTHRVVSGTDRVFARLDWVAQEYSSDFKQPGASRGEGTAEKQIYEASAGDKIVKWGETQSTTFQQTYRQMAGRPDSQEYQDFPGGEFIKTVKVRVITKSNDHYPRAEVTVTFDKIEIIKESETWQ
jgi:hypothetical protein